MMVYHQKWDIYLNINLFFHEIKNQPSFISVKPHRYHPVSSKVAMEHHGKSPIETSIFSGFPRHA